MSSPESGFLGQTHFNRGLGKLVVQLAPLAHPQVRQEILATPLHQLLVGQAFVALEAVPNVQIGKKVGLLVSKTLVRLGYGIARFKRPLARVLNRQRGRNHQYLRHAVVFLRRQQNACDFRVDGQARYLFAEFGQAVAGFACGNEFQTIWLITRQHLYTLVKFVVYISHTVLF